MPGRPLRIGIALVGALVAASAAADVTEQVRACDESVRERWSAPPPEPGAPASESPCTLGPDRLKEMIPVTIELRREIRADYPELTAEELKSGKGSVGIALLTRGRVDEGLGILVRESWLLSPSAQITLEALYEAPPVNLGLPPHDPRILAFYREHAALGWPRSEFMLGKILLFGFGQPEDAAEGLRLLEESDLPEAHVVLGDAALQRGDRAAAKRHYERAAEGGLAPGWYELAILAREEGDDAAAVALLQKALDADPRHNEARLELARHYERGAGVEASPEKAFAMMKDVADHGTGAAAAIAQTNVGIFYLNGTGVEPSVTQARIYLRKAASTGVLQAEQILQQLPR